MSQGLKGRTTRIEFAAEARKQLPDFLWLWTSQKTLGSLQSALSPLNYLTRTDNSVHTSRRWRASPSCCPVYSVLVLCIIGLGTSDESAQLVIFNAMFEYSYVYCEAGCWLVPRAVCRQRSSGGGGVVPVTIQPPWRPKPPSHHTPPSTTNSPRRSDLATPGHHSPGCVFRVPLPCSGKTSKWPSTGAEVAFANQLHRPSGTIGRRHPDATVTFHHN